jgi:hypothetical protein
MSRRIASFVVCAACLSFPAVSHSAGAMVRKFKEVRSSSEPGTHSTPVPSASGRWVPGPERLPNRTQLFPTYSWPLDHNLRDGYVLVNYIDHDPSSGLLDYEGGAWTYDGHNGTDITLYNFRLMDRGQRVLSGAPGTVFYTTYDKFDRNTGENITDTENNVLVDNGDGTTTWYLHLRRNSVTVQPGDVVARGSVLGLVGSSGNSTDAHLHFEVGQYQPGWQPRDPWNGPSNPQPSLWATQLPYVGAQHLWFADMGTLTAAAVGGDLNNFSVDYFKERISQPAILGANETNIPVWIELQGLAGDAYRIEILRPDGSLYSAVEYTLPYDVSYGWHFWYWNWGNANVPPSTYGMWSARVCIDFIEIKRVQFQVGASTVYGPRFAPIAGRSYRLNGSVQKDTVHVSPLGGPVTYSLLGAPAGVTLADSILTIPGTSPQATRSTYFQVIATDAGARRDTAWFHMVDLSKPLDPPVSVATTGREPSGISLSPSSPNPFAVSTRIGFVLPRAARVRLDVYDVAGRLVRSLLDESREAGSHSTTWDGVDAGGKRMRSGVYRCRLEADGRVLQRSLVLLH